MYKIGIIARPFGTYSDSLKNLNNFFKIKLYKKKESVMDIKIKILALTAEKDYQKQRKIFHLGGGEGFQY